MNASKVDIIDLTGVGLPRQDCQKAAVWMAKAFSQARKPNPACFHAENNHTYRTMAPKAATPALAMFFGGAPYESNVDMHETFWSSHLIGFQSQSQSRDRLTNKKRLAENEDWDRSLELAGQAEYISRLQELGEKSSNNNKEFGLIPSEYSAGPFTTEAISISQRRRLDRRRFVILSNPDFECRVKLGRTVPNYLLDKFGRMALFGSAAMICGILIFSTVAVKTLVRVTVVSLFFGFFSGVFIALPPVCFG
ncbi:hypothetical protein SUNI508_12157 [Seiridium unicorne]|uniref:Uncharacterized protein n=1 Tax=Seiridium unicorne TaxID=138068 RepID=A0ABR2UEK4_9PEZI